METGTEQDKILDLDVRDIPHNDRHALIFRLFSELGAGQALRIKVDHDPVHLLQHMKHEGLPVDASAYDVRMDEEGNFLATFRKESEKREDVTFTSFDKERSYLDDRFSPINVHNGPGYRVILTYIKAGQFIPVHSPGVDLVYAVFRGSGFAYVDGKKRKISPGDILVVSAGKSRGIEAETDMEALHIVSPIPDESDHEEVMRKLSEKKFL